MLSLKFISATLLAIVTASPAFAITSNGLSHEQLAKIRARLAESAHASWELGTYAEASLELDFPEISVFGAEPFPPPAPLNVSTNVISIAQKIIDTKPDFSKSLMVDGAAGDPMSNGISVLLANFSCPWDGRFLEDFEEQLDFILHSVPRGPNGQISHRTEYVQLWADSVFMVPPVVAYWGALHPGTQTERDMLYLAYDQIKGYRDVLRDPTDNTWRHVLMGEWEDSGKWATGQGWAAYGMLRVHQTIAKSTLRDEMSWALDNIVGWVTEIVSGTWAYQQQDGSLKNYIDRPDSFMEMSSTALMAATTYRLAVLTDATAWVPNADRAFELVKNMIDNDGWLLKPVDPYQFSVSSEHSPEGQSFVLMLQAAYRDYAAFQHGIGGSLAKVFDALADAAQKHQT